MSNSLAMLSGGAESLSVAEWEDYLGLDKNVRVGRKLYLRDPLKDASFRGARIQAVFGYHIGHEREDGIDKPSLVYIWNRDLHRLTWKNLETSTSSEYLNFARLLCQFHRERPGIDRTKSVLGQKIDEECPNISGQLDGLNLTWTEWGQQFEEYRFGCLFERERGSERSEMTRQGVLDCLAFHFDYFRLSSLMWEAIPMGFLSNLVETEKSDLARLHLQPKCFNLEVETAVDSFLWPWQRSLNWADRIEQKPIETTSLVFDIRKSTTALSELREEKIGAFSEFIKKIVGVSKKSILDHGGFFDKETGDGVIGHFVDFDNLTDSSGKVPPGKRAFDASVEMIRKASRICQDFQEDVHFEVEPLGGAVGLHSHKAVWIAEKGAVHAIGESVIKASRLADEAATRAIFMSKSQFVDLKEHLTPDQISLFEKQRYNGKEAKEGAGLAGYSVAITDNF